MTQIREGKSKVEAKTLKHQRPLESRMLTREQIIALNPKNIIASAKDGCPAYLYAELHGLGRCLVRRRYAEYGYGREKMIEIRKKLAVKRGGTSSP